MIRKKIIHLFVGFAFLAGATSALAQDKTHTITVNVSTKGGHLTVASEDGNFKFQVGGRVMIDAAWYNDDKNELGNGTEIRRARLFMKGTLWRYWDFKNQLDFAENKSTIKDAYLSYTAFKPTRIIIGNFKEPFSLEELTSSKYTTFMERALPNVFAPGRNIGFGFSTYGDNWTLAGGVYGEGIDDKGTKDEGWGTTGRVTFAPHHADAQVVHLGAAISYRTPDSDGTLKFEQRPESHIAGEKLVDTGTMTAIDGYIHYGLEAALVFGPFSLQGEYIATDVSRDGGEPDVSFDGWYTQASWFLTGESRTYKPGKGVFDRVKPKRVADKEGIGAWELGVRFSSLDLTDETVTGGEEDNLTVGLNWHATPNIRFMANYTQVLNLDRPGDKHHGDEPGLFQMRGQIDW